MSAWRARSLLLRADGVDVLLPSSDFSETVCLLALRQVSVALVPAHAREPRLVLSHSALPLGGQLLALDDEPN